MTKPNQLDALGNKSNIPNYPDKNVLEKVNNPKIGFRLFYKINLSRVYLYMPSNFSARFCLYNFRLCAK